MKRFGIVTHNEETIRKLLAKGYKRMQTKAGIMLYKESCEEP